MYVGPHSCMQGHTHVCRATLMYTGAPTCMQGHTHVYRGTLMYAGPHSCMEGHTHVYRGTLMYTGAHSCMQGHTHVCRATLIYAGPHSRMQDHVWKATLMCGGPSFRWKRPHCISFVRVKKQIYKQCRYIHTVGHGAISLSVYLLLWHVSKHTQAFG